MEDNKETRDNKKIQEKLEEKSGKIVGETSREISENVGKVLGNIEEKISETGKEAEEEISRETAKKHERQIMWVLFIMVAIIAAVFVIAFSVSETKKFDYVGLEWKKELFGQIPIYTTKISGTDEYGRQIEFNFNIRNDPKRLNVPLEGDMKLIKKPVYFSINFTNEAQKCSPAPLVNFGMFMAGMGYKVESVVAEEKDVGIYGQELVDCSNKQKNTVFIYTSGEETSIKQSPDNPNCYILTFKECENTEVLETLEVEIISKFTNESRTSGTGFFS